MTEHSRHIDFPDTVSSMEYKLPYFLEGSDHSEKPLLRAWFWLLNQDPQAKFHRV